MAEARAQDVVNEAQSMDDKSSIDVSGKTFTSNGIGEGEEQSRVNVDGSGDSHVTSNIIQTNPLPESGTTQASDYASYSKLNSELNGKVQVDTLQPSAVDSNNVNGLDTVSFTGSEDTGYQNLVGTDESVTSDTDHHRAEGVDHTSEHTQLRERSNSIKKPASFKAVSVTKNFLAKSGGTPLATVKLGAERGSLGNSTSTTPPQPAKPRLVAKSGRDARSLNAVGGVGASSGPDASKVWNRNRPVAPPPPKQFTDEELKQQYGIHMATRLQADEAGKASKWADIDDDEDDWAPETVQWMDGTKSTLLPSDAQPASVKPSSTPQSWKGSNEADSPPAQPSQLASSISTIGKTILRPGARVATQTKPGLVLKSVPENQSQPEKPEASSSSSKSPWAPLPPVDRASPITFYPPATAVSQSSFRKDSAVQDDEQHAQSPAREIAADDFDRSWRESGDRSSRELFNSQSGRYEPVKNVRRSSRPDQGFRPPSVLQRPSQQGPAEPSAAFQSRDSRSWSQRRDSSSMGSNPNVSYERRASMDHEARVISQTTKSPSSHPSPATGDARLAAGGLQKLDSSDSSAATQGLAQPTETPESMHVTSVPEEDSRLVQQQLMRERIERNRKRKQEEEAREEAERKERIRLKMEALGPPSPGAKKSNPVEPQPIQSQDSAEAPGENQQPRGSETSPSTDQRSAIESRNAQQKAKAQLQTETLKPTVATEPSISSRSQLSSSKSPVESSKASLPDGGLTSTKTPEVQLPGLGRPLPTERQTRSWGRMPQNLEPSANWVNKPIGQGPGSVWGPPTSDRPLGNGAFESEMSRMPTMQMAPGHQIGPGPLRAPSISPFEAAHPTPSPPPYLQPRQDVQPQAPPTLSPSTATGSTFQQTPLHHSNGQRFQRQQQQDPTDMGAAKRAWQNFSANAAAEDAAIRERAERDWAAKLAEEQRGGAKKEHQPIFRETFRQTVPGDILGQRRVVSVAQTVHDGQTHMPYGQRATSQSAPIPHTVNGRASRFFGPTVDRMPQSSGIPTYDEDLIISSKSISPPPPETVEHPVHGAQGQHPLVNLPKVLKVKLPPTQNAEVQRQQPVQMPPLGRYHTGHQPLVNQTAWQDRFNGLFGRTPKASQPASTTPMVEVQSPNQSPNIQAAPISSSTKTAFDETWAPNATTVSLPQGSEQNKSLHTMQGTVNFGAESKPTEEELVDEREFGSSPTVRLFKGRHPREEKITSDSTAFHRGLVGNTQIAYYEKSNKDFPASASALSFEYLDQDYFQSSGVRIRIRICGKPTSLKILPRKANTNAQSRKVKPRNPPRKPHQPLKGSRPNTAAANTLQDNPAIGKKALASKSSPKSEAQVQDRENRSTADNKKKDGNTISTLSVNSDQPNKLREGAVGESVPPSQLEKSRSNSQWAKPHPRSQHRQRNNPVRA